MFLIVPSFSSAVNNFEKVLNSFAIYKFIKLDDLFYGFDSTNEQKELIFMMKFTGGVMDSP